jgi:hypothetical protein
MKTTIKFLLGLTVFILATSAAPNSVRTAKGITSLAANKMNAPAFKEIDSYYVTLAYVATSQGSGNYDIKIDLVSVDETTGALALVNATSNIAVTMTSGPFAGGSFTFPSGSNSMDFGSFHLGGTPSGSISATVNPTTMYGVTLAPQIAELSELP